MYETNLTTPLCAFIFVIVKFEGNTLSLGKLLPLKCNLILRLVVPSTIKDISKNFTAYTLRVKVDIARTTRTESSGGDGKVVGCKEGYVLGCLEGLDTGWQEG
jgi:hypothetical protein